MTAASIWLGLRGGLTLILGMFKGERFLRPRLWQLVRRGLFFLPDRSLLHRYLTCGHHLDAVSRAAGGEWTKDILRVLGLADLLGRKPDELSAGECRRVEVALAVARQPDCLIADELFEGIMPRDRDFLDRALRELASAGSAIVVTGHEVRSLLDLADEVFWLTAGTTHFLGDPNEACRHDQFRREYLGSAFGDRG